ncbi:Leucine Rich repeats (2 copies) [compost metagenome]
MNVGENKISEISPQIKHLKNIVSLNLANNQLKSLPKEITDLKNLKTLILTGNPMSTTQVEDLRKQMPNTQIYF